MNYRVSHMYKVDFEELLWLCFGVRHVYILISGINFLFFKNFKCSAPPPMIWLIYQIFSRIQILKMSKIIRGPFKKVKNKFLFLISKCTHFSTIKMMGENVWHQKRSHSSSLKSTPIHMGHPVVL